MKRQFTKHYSVAEARAAIPLLRNHFAGIHSCRQRMINAEQALQTLTEKTGGDIGGAAADELARATIEFRLGILRIHRMGILIKDIDRGLVDFPHLRDGEEVLLCWELEEDDIEFWHDLQSGYAGRERLQE
jgi:hypothetical protein